MAVGCCVPFDYIRGSFEGPPKDVSIELRRRPMEGTAEESAVLGVATLRLVDYGLDPHVRCPS